MRVDLFDFELPNERIALRPARPRDAARMLVVRGGERFVDAGVSNLPDLLEPGDVLVVSVAGSGAYGYWGDLLTVSAQARGLAGLVIDGCVRDRDEIAKTGFPVFSAGLTIRGTSKQGLGLVNHPIACGGQLVWPGDLVLGDADGLVAVAREAAGEVLQRARDRESFEAGERAALAAGDELTLDRFGLREGLSALGMNER